MSTANEESRNSRRGNDNRSTQQHRSNAGSRDGTSGTQQNRKSGKGGPNVNRSSETPRERSGSPSLQLQEEHVPLPGFNTTEVDTLLKKNFDPKTPLYKPESKSQNSSSGNVWGSKAGAMSNGKDFWLELRKQVTALQQTGGTQQGG